MISLKLELTEEGLLKLSPFFSDIGKLKEE